MNRLSVAIDSNGLVLEGVLHRPDAEERARCVVAHPHPQYGGSMDNNVVYALCDALCGAGITALRFNFRGVGGSQGGFAGGPGEAEDYLAAVRFCRQDFGGPVFACGYSFGAYVATLACDKGLEADALALVSPPVDFIDLSFPSTIRMPLFIISGDRDMFCSLESLRRLTEGIASPVVVSGADHFWMGNEGPMVEKVTRFFETRM